MHSDVRWLIPDRVFCMRLAGTLTPENLDAALAQCRALLAQDHVAPVHVILDLTATQRDETMIVKLKQSVDELRKMHPPPPQAGWTIIADSMPNQIVKSIGASITQVIKIRTRFTTGVQEGLDFLRRIDATLPAADQELNTSS
ncbi:MAG: hypothetical protein KC547_04855 [Anaerolineae bacterium]|nr:hypothetical protein [Anaerolineae bacterium]MCA9908333.1 hypothetical protein [Anaerolineae bacterium]